MFLKHIYGTYKFDNVSFFLVHFGLKNLKVYFGEKYTLLYNAVMF